LAGKRFFNTKTIKNILLTTDGNLCILNGDNSISVWDAKVLDEKIMTPQAFKILFTVDPPAPLGKYDITYFKYTQNLIFLAYENAIRTFHIKVNMMSFL
jgi:hypothetical protein